MTWYTLKYDLKIQYIHVRKNIYKTNTHRQTVITAVKPTKLTKVIYTHVLIRKRKSEVNYLFLNLM